MLATPLSICLVVLGQHVDRLKVLDVMLGARPQLTPPELVYQRMLARDSVEAAEQAEEFLKEKLLLEEMLVEALKLAQTDADRGFLMIVCSAFAMHARGPARERQGFYDVPPEVLLLRFLDTRGLGDAGRDASGGSGSAYGGAGSTTGAPPTGRLSSHRPACTVYPAGMGHPKPSGGFYPWKAPAELKARTIKRVRNFLRRTNLQLQLAECCAEFWPRHLYEETSP